MDGTTNKMSGLSSEETLERFVIRARRVENNSLVKSGDVERYAIPKMTYNVTESGDASIQYHVCTDEEAVESLATRLHPFIVKSEPIYLLKILETIYAQVPCELLSEDEAGTLKTTESWFSHRYEKKDSERYGIQLMRKDGEPLTELLSDALLADAWIYTDAVHADPKGKKAEARKLSYSDRYRAASSYYCEFASVIVSLLNLIRALSERNLLQVPDSAWSEPVSYAEANKRDQEQIIAGSAYVFPIGAGIPEGANLQDIPGARRATPAVMHRLQHPEDAAVVISFDADWKQTGRYEAICSNEGGSLVFRIDDIGNLIVSKEVTTQDSGPIGSISFTASELHPSEAHNFLSSIAPPNALGLEFISGDKPTVALLEFSKSIESASK